MIEVIMLYVASTLSMLIARYAYKGYVFIKSPTFLRLFLAFVFIGIGFPLLQFKELTIIGLIIQSVGYFWLALSYSIQSTYFKYFIPLMTLISFALSTLFIIPTNSLEYIIRSISFVLIVYGTINIFITGMESRNLNTIITASGLSILALAELIIWYSFIYPYSIFALLSIILKIAGLSTILTPIVFKTRGVKIGV